MATVTVSIGRGTRAGLGALIDDSWAHFKANTLNRVCNHTSQVYFEGQGNGQFNGQHEDSYTIVAEFDSPRASEFFLALSQLARQYGQECIAVTFGETEFIGPDA